MKLSLSTFSVNEDISSGIVYPHNRYGDQSSVSRTCRACNDSGTNYKFMISKCERCCTEITFRADSPYPPRYCRDCKEIVKREKEEERERRKREKEAQWRETRCENCGTTIKYHIDWGRIPKLCKSCKEKEKAKWRETKCQSCGNSFKYHIDSKKIPTLCKSCFQKEQENWIEKKCEHCGKSFRVHKSKSSRTFCKDCLSKHTKTCMICKKSFLYNPKTKEIPKSCPECRRKVKEEEKSYRKQRGKYEKIKWSDDKPLPGSSRSLKNLKSIGISGASVNQYEDGGYHVTMFTKDNERFSYDTDKFGNIVTKKIHFTDRAAMLLKEGFDGNIHW